jgi:hypothetical protein
MESAPIRKSYNFVYRNCSDRINEHVHYIFHWLLVPTNLHHFTLWANMGLGERYPGKSNSLGKKRDHEGSGLPAATPISDVLSHLFPPYSSHPHHSLFSGSFWHTGLLISRGEACQFSFYPSQWLWSTHHLQQFSWDLRADLMLVICWEGPDPILLSILAWFPQW